MPNQSERTMHLLTVVSQRHVTPNMIRVTLTGPRLRDIPSDCAGGHFKLFLPEPQQTQEAFDQQLLDGPRPVARTYTVRHARPELAEIDVDFVAHGDEGPASAWAAKAKVGDFCGFAGPGTPKIVADAEWYVLAADMSALPVVFAALESLPQDAKGVAIFEVTSPEDKQEITVPPGISQHWLLHGDPHQPSDAQLKTLAGLDWPKGSVRTLIAGETGTVSKLRLFTRGTRGVDRTMSYASGYWRIGLAEDEHQKVKRQEVEADEQRLAVG